MIPETGYLHPGYTAAMSEFGTPVDLPRSGARILRRRIDGSSDHDGLGGYPYLVCRDWKALAADLDDLGNDFVSISAAPDPFGDFTLEDLHRAFPHRVVLFKEHFVADLTQPLDAIVSKKHRKTADRALRMLSVELVPQPLSYLDTWMDLWSQAVERFQIRGVRAFSRQSFGRHFALPGVWMSIARQDGKAVAAHVQMIHGNVVYAHVAAGTSAAHGLGASYALYFKEVEHYQAISNMHWMDWGGVAGVTGARGGLSEFKSGWSTGTRPAYFCGRISDPARYTRLVHSSGVDPTLATSFPTYRHGEFG
jgi:hypothetical protein